MKKFLLFCICSIINFSYINALGLDKVSGNGAGMDMAGKLLGKECVIYKTIPGKYTVYNACDGNGFVILSADNDDPTVLGYGNRGCYNDEKAPVQLKEMLDKFVCLPDGQVKKSRAQQQPLRSAGKVMNTAEWGQEAGYNDLTPSVAGSHCLTGCGATALAILMKYYNYPSNGIGYWEYTREGISASFDYDNNQFDWSKMPDKVTETTSADERKEVATLMLAAGVALGAGYGVDQTIHTAGNEPCALSYFFGFSPDCQYIYKENFSDEEFLELTLEQIDKGEPVLYSGAPLDINMGHLWVVDGYNEDGTLLHCNWGWNGYLNGYYALNELMGRYFCDGMVLNARPAKPDEDYMAPKFQWAHFLYGAKSGIQLNVAEIKENESFRFNCLGISLRPESESTPYDFSIGLVDKDGNLKEILYINRDVRFTFNPAINKTAYMTNFGFDGPAVKVPQNVRPDDRIQVFYNNHAGGSDVSWYPIAGALDAKSSCSVTGITPVRMNKLEIRKAPDVTVRYNLLKKEEDTGNYVWDMEEAENGTLLEEWPGTSFTLEYSIIEKVPGKEVIYDFDGHIRGEFAPALQYGVSGWPSGSTEVNNRVTFSYGGENTVVANFRSVGTTESLTVNCPTPGTLSGLLSKETAQGLLNLTVKGEINAYDIWYIADNTPLLKSLNLSGVKIAACEVDDLPWYESGFVTDSFNEAYKLPSGAFNEMNMLESLELPEIKKIGANSLCVLKSLEELTLPETLESVEQWSIRGFKHMRIISLNPVPPVLSEGCFEGSLVDSDGELYVPAEAVEAYKKDPAWGRFAQIAPIGSSIKDVLNGEDESCDGTVEIFSLYGIMIYSGAKDKIPALPTGVYVYKCDTSTEKMYVR